MGTSLKSQTVPNSSVDQSIPTTGKPLKIPTNSKGKGIDIGSKKRGNTNVLTGSSKKRGTIRIGSPIKRGEDNQVTEGGSMGNLTAEHKMDMEALAEVQREIAAKEETKQERIRQMWAGNEANALYWENIAKEFRDDELNRQKDSLEAAYSFYIISEFQDNELNAKNFKFDANGTGSTADKAFDVYKDKE
nr:hypothetical protein [Tanacetum cinerariifolium]